MIWELWLYRGARWYGRSGAYSDSLHIIAEQNSDITSQRECNFFALLRVFIFPNESYSFCASYFFFATFQLSWLHRVFKDMIVKRKSSLRIELTQYLLFSGRGIFLVSIEIWVPFSQLQGSNWRTKESISLSCSSGFYSFYAVGVDCIFGIQRKEVFLKGKFFKDSHVKWKTTLTWSIISSKEGIIWLVVLESRDRWNVGARYDNSLKEGY